MSQYFKFIIILIFFSSMPIKVLARGIELPWQDSLNTSIPHDLLHREDKRIFQFSSSNGPTIKGYILGPEDGKPMIAISGTVSNPMYMHQLAIAAAQKNFKVYVFAPRGFGTKEFQTENLGDNDKTKIQDMSSDLLEIIDYVYNKNSKQKVILMGHSLGGYLLHSAELGVHRGKDRKTKFNETLSQRFFDQVLFKVPLSPAAMVHNVVPGKDVEKLLFETFPTLVNYKTTTESFLRVLNKVPASSYFVKSMSYGTNFFTKKFIDTSYLTGNEIIEAGLYSLSDQFPKDIFRQYQLVFKWADLKIKSNNELISIRDRFMDLNRVQRVPVLTISAKNDYIATYEAMLTEQAFYESVNLASKLVFFPGGHMNTVLGKKRSQQIIDHIIKFQNDIKKDVPQTSCQNPFHK